MFRIRRVFDDLLAVDRMAMAQVQEILRIQFPEAADKEWRDIPAKLRNPLKYRFRTVLYVAETRDQVRGFALMLHVPDLEFCYLDYISTLPGRGGGGVGGALYARLRGESRLLGARGLFYECPSDDPAFCRVREIMPQNRARVRFYERAGGRVIVGTEYEAPMTPGGDPCPPSLIHDGLGRGGPLRRDWTRQVVRAVLERKYGKRCPPGYIDRIERSFADDPVRLRPPSGMKEAKPADAPGKGDIVLTVNDKHDIHHVHERGYVESPARVRSILRAIEHAGLFLPTAVQHHSERHILAVHDRAMVTYFKKACASLPEGKSIYPYVFPLRNQARPPKELPVRAGYYCLDTFTPLNSNAYLAARRAVDCTLTAARSLLSGFRQAYALVRPPGHHAERKAFGGFCYFNNAAIAAQYLSGNGRVAVLDLDYHHGNGTQDIFYARSDVLTISIHGHPSFAYPYFCGFAEEKGEAAGLGANFNYPLGEEVDGEAYRKTLHKALAKIKRFDPLFLVVSLGLDPAKGDPTGTWSLTAEDFEKNGRLVGGLALPTLVVQEGGYKVPSLGRNARRFFSGLRTGLHDRTRQA